MELFGKMEGGMILNSHSTLSYISLLNVCMIVVGDQLSVVIGLALTSSSPYSSSSVSANAPIATMHSPLMK